MPVLRLSSLLSSDEVQKDFVIKTLPVSYPDELVEGSTVTIVVSTGEEPVPDESVPNIKETSLEQAIQRLSEKGFVVDRAKIVYENHPTYAAGTVISQSPAGDTMAKPGSEVVLTVSTGYRDLSLTVPLPDVDYGIDLRVYIDGTEQTGSDYTNLKGFLPSVKKSVTTPLRSRKPLIESPSMSPGLDRRNTTICEYMVDGTTGRATQISLNRDVLESSGSSATSEPDDPVSTPDWWLED